MSNRGRKHPRRLSATDLAELGRCERQAMYRYHKHAERVHPALAVARRRGIAEHDRRHQEVISSRSDATRSDRGPCFIASAIYGPYAWQTEVLRDWRDRALLPTRAGRILVGIYYRVSPGLAAYLSGMTRTSRLVRAVLDQFVARVRE